jgi:hypothetical protein
MGYQTIACWRDSKAYTLKKQPSIERWAWQFLRRNREYQHDYDILVRRRPDGWTMPAPQDDLAYFICNPPAINKETYKEYARRLQSEGVHKHSIESLYSARLRKYELFEMVAPESETPPRFRRRRVPFKEFFFGDLPIDARTLLDTEAGALFDLSLPLREQLTWVGQILDHEQRKLIKRGKVFPREHRVREPNYPLYLRLLDAEASGAKVREMADILIPDHEGGREAAVKNVRDGLKAAKQLRDGGYLQLLSGSWGKPPTIAVDK